MLLSIEIRVADVLSRRDHKMKLKDERRIAEDAFAERERLRNEALEAAKTVSSYHVLIKCRNTRTRSRRGSMRWKLMSEQMTLVESIASSTRSHS